MLRKVIFAVCAFALILVACGRQVTPNRTNGVGLQPGQMQIKINTQGPVDFVNNWYVLAFDLYCTGGQPCEPYALNGNQTKNWLNWDFELIMYQPNASSSVQVAFYQFVQGTNGSTTRTPYPLTSTLTPADIVVNPNCNGANTQICVTFNRRIFNGVQIGPSPSPGASPTPQPTNGPAGRWYVNWFVASPLSAGSGGTTGSVVYAPGLGGINDTTFQFPASTPGIDVTTNFDQQWIADQSWPTAPSPSAQITGGEVINNP